MEKLHPPVEMLDKRRAAFDPVSVVIIGYARNFPDFGSVDMAAHNALHTAHTGRSRHNLLVTGDEFNGILDLVLGHLGKRPIGQVEPLTDAIDDEIQAEKRSVCSIAQKGEPTVRKHDGIEFIAMKDKEATAIRARLCIRPVT